MNEENKAVELKDPQLEQVSGGNGGYLPLLPVVLPIVSILYGGRRCELCSDQPARRALKNHYMNIHGLSYEMAMAYVPPELRDSQW